MREVSIPHLAKEHAAGATVIDVREPEEYREAHVPGAILIPMGQLSWRSDEVPRGGPVYVICRSGNRSKSSADLLEFKGFDAYSVAGGTLEWIQQGHRFVTGSQPHD